MHGFRRNDPRAVIAWFEHGPATMRMHPPEPPLRKGGSFDRDSSPPYEGGARGGSRFVLNRSVKRSRLVLALALGMMARDARAEDLRDAWAIALGTNPQLQASRQTTESAGLELASSRSSRLPQIQTLNAQSFLTNPISVASSSGQPKAASGGQEQFTISAVAAIVPIYTGGRIRNTIASNGAQLQRLAGRRGHHGPGPEAHRRPRLRGGAPGESGRRRGSEQCRQPHGPGA